MTHPLLAIDNLSIAFRQQGETQTVVHNLSLEVAVGETLALVGESGSGKSISALSVLRLLPTPRPATPAVTSVFMASRCCMRMRRPCAACAATGSR
ncbi:ABC transporter ATP-binding protein [Klebsiella pneumoniae]|nr:ABC transporter ATP-binding protein [Klebsiella pneumoniae]